MILYFSVPAQTLHPCKYMVLHLLVSFLFASTPVFACKPAPEYFDLKSYLRLHETNPSFVAFLGKVHSVTETPSSGNFLSAENIEFETRRWWRGNARKIVVVAGYSLKKTGNSCDGTFDFSAKVGQEWLIFGHIKNGIVYPQPLLSTQTYAGQLPQEKSQMLGKGYSLSP